MVYARAGNQTCLPTLPRPGAVQKAILPIINRVLKGIFWPLAYLLGSVPKSV